MSPLMLIRRRHKLPWHSTGARADWWDGIRQGLHPRPSAAAFVDLCDEYHQEALQFNPDWDSTTVREYIIGRLQGTRRKPCLPGHLEVTHRILERTALGWEAPKEVA